MRRRRRRRRLRACVQVAWLCGACAAHLNTSAARLTQWLRITSGADQRGLVTWAVARRW